MGLLLQFCHSIHFIFRAICNNIRYVKRLPIVFCCCTTVTVKKTGITWRSTTLLRAVTNTVSQSHNQPRHHGRTQDVLRFGGEQLLLESVIDIRQSHHRHTANTDLVSVAAKPLPEPCEGNLRIEVSPWWDVKPFNRLAQWMDLAPLQTLPLNDTLS